MTQIDISRYYQEGTGGLRALYGTRVTGTTAGGTNYVGTVTGTVDNLYLRIDVDGGGWTRSDTVITVA